LILNTYSQPRYSHLLHAHSGIPVPLARIITRAVEESQELAAELRGRGFDVEIVSPSDAPKTRPDVELRLEECTPEEALIRAGVLPETNDMAVFIAPGAISNRRERPAIPFTPAFPVQRKWYEAIPDATTLPPEVLPFELKPLEEDLTRDTIESQEQAIENDALSLVVDRSKEELAVSEMVDREDEPLFATAAAELALQVSDPKPPETIAAIPIKAELPVLVTPLAAKVEGAKRIEPRSAVGRLPMMSPQTSPVRRVRIPVLAWKSQLLAWKSAAGFAAIAVLVLIMGAWVLRKAPVPADLGSVASTVQQSAPISKAQTKPVTPAVERPAPAAVSRRVKPVETNTSSLIPQAAAAVTPPPVPKQVSAQKRAASVSRPREDDTIAIDTVTRLTTRPPKVQDKARAKPSKSQTHDGIKRYSDLN
jgi:hypothetical protein